MRRLAYLFALGLVLSEAWAAGPSIHTVITTECSKYFTWQTLGMFYSHRKSGQPGPITRIMCCTPEEYERLPAADRDLVPTHVAPSYTVHPRTRDVYSAYNKPVAVIDWLAKNDIKEEYVLIIDADMIMREPFLPQEVGSKPGRAVSAYFGYMKGVNNELALKHVPEVLPRNDTLAGPRGRRGDMVGGFTLMHREDLRRVAPLWLKYTEDVRFDPDAWTLTGDAYSTHKGDRPWISEMYGYSFGASKADVWHVCHHTAMLYPGYEVSEPPKVLHYGLLWNVEGTDYSFDKHWHYDFDPLACPPWNIGTDSRRSKRGLFAHPPRPSDFKTTSAQLLRDLLAIEVVVTLNEAFCERHRKNCPPSEEMERECNKADEIARELEVAFDKMELPDPCRNHDIHCDTWAQAMECINNPGFMFDHCMLACHLCEPRAKRAKAAQGQTQLGEKAAENTARRDEITRKKVEEIERVERAVAERAAQAANKPLDTETLTKPGASGGGGGGGLDKLRGGGGAHLAGRKEGLGARAGGGQQQQEQQQQGRRADEELQKRLQRRCTSHHDWTIQQVKECLSRAEQGLPYEPEAGGAGGQRTGGGDLDLPGGGGGGADDNGGGDADKESGGGAEEELPREDLEPRHLRQGGGGGGHAPALHRLNVSALKSRVTSDLHDAEQLLGERVQRTKRIAIKVIRQSEEAVVDRLGWGGVLLWAGALLALLFGLPYLRGRHAPPRNGRFRTKGGRSE